MKNIVILSFFISFLFICNCYGGVLVGFRKRETKLCIKYLNQDKDSNELQESDPISSELTQENSRTRRNVARKRGKKNRRRRKIRRGSKKKSKSKKQTSFKRITKSRKET